MFAGEPLGTGSAQDLDELGGPEKVTGLEDAGEGHRRATRRGLSVGFPGIDFRDPWGDDREARNGRWIC